jgi:LPXTG-motif cell wall-anchored protein
VVDAAAAARITKAAEAAPAAVEGKAPAPAADNTTMMLAIGGGMLAVVGIAAFVLTRKNK